MSANLVVDVGGTCQFTVAFTSGNVSCQICGLSGRVGGPIVDLLHAYTMCNVGLVGLAALSSGPLIVGIQTADVTTSGDFTDPTSGIPVADLPQQFNSGGNLIIGSGSTGYVYASGVSGTAMQSGWVQYASFVRPGRYARVIINSGFYIGTLQVHFLSQLKTTGSGGGFTYNPGSGTINV